MNQPDTIVIVGGGHAAAALCAALAAAGAGHRVHLVCEEPDLPYQRPPLSKSFLKNPQDTPQPLRSEAWYVEAGITVHRADPAVAIDRAKRCLRLQSGSELGYGHLVLATGTRARRLPGLAADLQDGLVNVAALRSAADAFRLRGLFEPARRLTVLGGGFIGLEIAATAAAMGKQVVVLEAAPRLLARSVSAEIAAHVLDVHRASGIDIRLGAAASGFDIEGDRLAGITVDGVREPVDLLVSGIGAVPEDTLARAAGLPCDNGVLVDGCLRTADPHILAIGDCARFPDARAGGALLRLESVQNANDQARTAAATLAGGQEPYAALPWFWSEQGALRLQMAGLVPSESTRYRRPGATAATFSILHYVGDRLACVESVNSPLDHLSARKLLETGRSPEPALACDPAVALKTLV